MFDDIIGNPSKPDPAPYIRAVRGEVAETNTSGYVLVIYVDPTDGEMYYFKYITKKKFKMGDEVEIMFTPPGSSPCSTQICDQWTVDNKRKSEVCVEEIRKVKK